MTKLKTLGLRHVALNVLNAQVSKQFYTDFFNMTVEWEPDSQNVYLTSESQDNLALHESKVSVDPKNQSLDHIGFMIADKEGVDAFYKQALEKNIPIAKEIKEHRDGAYSFYLKDPDGYIVQVIYHPPVAKNNI